MGAADAWLRSTCWQNRRSTRLTEDLDCYGERLAPAAALDDIVAEVAKSCGGVNFSPETFSAILANTIDGPISAPSVTVDERL